MAVVVLILFGGFGGYQAAQIEREKSLAAMGVESLLEQYTLAVQDLEAGRHDIARQRFEYVLARDPAFPGAADGLAQAMQVLFASATPSPIPPTITPTPTQDLRPIEDLYSQALNYFDQKDWDSLIDVVMALRRGDLSYHVVDVDHFLYRALRNRGLGQIRDYGNLEGGIYDLTLAEAFGPLDNEALTFRDLARFYMMGSSFWEVFPEQAVYYFGLVSSAAPSLRDASGWTAAARFHAVLLQYADQLAREGAWCEAQGQYELALSYGADAAVQPTAEYAAYQCAPPTETLSPETETPGPTVTSTPSSTPVYPGSPTITLPVFETPTFTPTVEILPTENPSPTPTQPIIISPTPQPSDTPNPTVLPSPTDTVTLPPTETPQPPPPTEPIPSATVEASPTGSSQS